MGLAAAVKVVEAAAGVILEEIQAAAVGWGCLHLHKQLPLTPGLRAKWRERRGAYSNLHAPPQITVTL